MNRHKSYFGPSLVFVAAAYLGLFYWVQGFSNSSPEPLPEGHAVEWMELSAPAAGEPEPSSSPTSDVVAKALPEKAPAPAPPRAEERAEEEPPTLAPVPVAAAQPTPPPAPPAPEPLSAEEIKEAWTAPDSEIAVPSEPESEPALESYAHDFTALPAEDAEDSFAEEPASAVGALSDEDFLEPEERVATAAAAASAESVSPQEVTSRDHGVRGGQGEHDQGPAFSNPYVDPNAPPVGRHGVLDAKSLQAAAGNPPPAYPVSDRLARREGVVVLLGYVNADGKLSRVTVETEASSAMTQESFRSFKNYRYRPGQAGWVRQTFRFTLRGQPQEMKATLRGAR